MLRGAELGNLIERRAKGCGERKEGLDRGLGGGGLSEESSGSEECLPLECGRIEPRPPRVERVAGVLDEEFVHFLEEGLDEILERTGAGRVVNEEKTNSRSTDERSHLPLVELVNHTLHEHQWRMWREFLERIERRVRPEV